MWIYIYIILGTSCTIIRSLIAILACCSIVPLPNSSYLPPFISHVDPNLPLLRFPRPILPLLVSGFYSHSFFAHVPSRLVVFSLCHPLSNLVSPFDFFIPEIPFLSLREIPIDDRIAFFPANALVVFSVSLHVSQPCSITYFYLI